MTEGDGEAAMGVKGQTLREREKAATHIALLRGVNVGRAKRVAMADLRALVAGLGYRDVRTLLASGNVVFTAPGVAPEEAAARIERELPRRTGVSARVQGVGAAELAAAVAGNPLLALATDPSRLHVAFLADRQSRTRLESLVDREWAPEAFALGERVAYLWCPEGVLAGRLPVAVQRLLGEAVTLRNWATVARLLAMTCGSSPGARRTEAD